MSFVLFLKQDCESSKKKKGEGGWANTSTHSRQQETGSLLSEERGVTNMSREKPEVNTMVLDCKKRLRTLVSTHGVIFRRAWMPVQKCSHWTNLGQVEHLNSDSKRL